MSSKTLFISDLHLSPSDPKITDLFLAFLAQHHPLNLPHTPLDALYILGDLFEVWIGDDTTSPYDKRVMECLRQYTEHGIPVYIMHGNRDFLIGKSFLSKTGCNLLSDPSVIELYGKRVLLMHGDLLCTLDTAYQWFRKIVRCPLITTLFLSLARSWRLMLAHKIHSHSSSNPNNPHRASARYDATPAAIRKQLRKHQAQILIHGHTHKPGIHTFSLDGQMAKRIVLGAWGKTGSVLSVTPHTMDLEVFENA